MPSSGRGFQGVYLLLQQYQGQSQKKRCQRSKSYAAPSVPSSAGFTGGSLIGIFLFLRLDDEGGVCYAVIHHTVEIEGASVHDGESHPAIGGNEILGGEKPLEHVLSRKMFHLRPGGEYHYQAEEKQENPRRLPEKAAFSGRVVLSFLRIISCDLVSSPFTTWVCKNVL